MGIAQEKWVSKVGNNVRSSVIFHAFYSNDRVIMVLGGQFDRSFFIT